MDSKNSKLAMIDSLDVLVVDDSLTSRKFLREILVNLGCHSIVEEKNGLRALEQVKKSKFDLIVSDWDMPEMSGLELLGAVRKNEGTEKIPFLMVTSHDQKEQVLEAIKAGASDYIVKPFNHEIIESKILQVLSIDGEGSE